MVEEKTIKLTQDKQVQASENSEDSKDLNVNDKKPEKNKEEVKKNTVKPSQDPADQASEPSSITTKDNKNDEKEKPVKEEKIKEQSEKEAPKKSEKKPKEDRIGVLNIYTSFNNTIMNLTDLSGKSIAKFSGGQSTKQDRLKANPTIAMFIAQKVAEESKDNGLTGFYVKIRAQTGQNNPGPGAHAAIKSLTRAGFKILSIMDTTKVPRGGPKKKGGRRGRRP